MKNMDKGLTVPKWVLFGQKYPKCLRIYLPNLFAQAQKFCISMKKRLHWASVVRGVGEGTVLMQQAETTDGLHDKCHESIILIK